MADYQATDSPLRASSNSRPASTRSTRSLKSQRSSRTSETTPLLTREPSSDHEDGDEENGRRSPAASSLLRSLHSPVSSKQKSHTQRRWPSFIALILLCVFTVAIMLLGFFVPEVMEEYAMQAKEFELSSIGLPNFTSTGAKARVQGTFWMNASRVKRKSVRDLGVFGTWLAREVRSEESRVVVSLPEYGGVVLGSAVIPPVKVNVRNGRKTAVDFLADLEPGEVDGIRKLADDWISGRIGQLRVRGDAAVKIKSGILSLGTQSISQSMVFAGDEIPGMPKFNITRVNVHEVKMPDSTKAMAANVSVMIENRYPVDLAVPPLGFNILVDNCLPSEPYILVANAFVRNLTIHPREDVKLNASGTVRQLPAELTGACPGSKKSPLDALLSSYMGGKDTTVYVRGSASESLGTPKWITELISGITVPIVAPQRSFNDLIKNFTMADLHFSLPDPWAEPDTPEAKPKISALIKVFVNLPEQINLPVDVNRVRADADVYHKGKKLGRLNLDEWQHANSTRIEAHDKQPPALLVESAINNAPLDILDEDAFSDVVQALLFGGKPVHLTVKAKVDVKVTTTLGDVTIRQLPAEGKVPVKPIPIGKGGLTSFSPQIGNLKILDTRVDGLSLQAEVNFTNPTNYSATVPYFDILILTNGTELGHATARNVSVVPGENRGVIVQADWEPFVAGGRNGKAVGRELLSQYLSGFNTTLSLRTHKGTIPSSPAIGRALEGFTITFPTPRLHNPKPPSDGDDAPPEDDGKPHFIQEATMHLFTSTASFILLSPLSKTTLYVTRINATAFYKTDDVGKILYELPFAVPPGSSETPRLPVDWSIGSVGYEAVRKALGGELRLSAKADVGLKIGDYAVDVWFKGGGIGAKVRL